MNSKNKGKRGELELAKVLRLYGWNTRRGQQFKGSPESPDVMGLPGIHIECKRVERLNIEDALAQSYHDAGPGEIPVVMHRKNNARWLVTMTLDQWIQLYTEWEAGQHHE